MAESDRSKRFRLKSVYLFIYQFEKTDEKVHYITQFIGAKPNKENREYINMLVSLGHRTFRAPINQGNVAIDQGQFSEAILLWQEALQQVPLQSVQ